MATESVQRRLGRNVALLGSAELVSRGLSFLVALIAARFLGPAEFGQVALTQIVVFFLAAVGDAGLTTWTQRQIVLRPHDLSRLIVETLVAQLAIAIALGGALVAVIVAFPLSGGTDRLILLALPFAVTEGLSIVYALQALERMKPAAGVRIVTQFFTVVTILIGLALDSVEVVVCASWVGQLVGDVLAYLMLRRYLHWVRPRLGSVGRALRAGAPILATRALYQYAFGIGGFLLAAYAGKQAVGYYNAATRPLALAPVVLIVLINAVFPELVRRGAGGSVQVTEFTLRMISSSLRGSLIVAIVLSIEAEPVVALLYGPDYQSAVALLRVTAFLFPVFCLSLLLIQTYLALGRSMALVVACAVGAVFGTASVPVLYGWDGITGVAVGTVLTGLVIGLSLAAASRTPSAKTLARVVTLEALCGGVIFAAALAVSAVLPGPPALSGGLTALGVAFAVEVVRGFPTRRDIRGRQPLNYPAVVANPSGGRSP